MTNITVDKNNRAYCSVDGILYNKRVSELVRYPAGKTDPSFSIPDTVKTVGDLAFEECGFLKSISIPASVCNIGDQPFSGCTGITEFCVDEGSRWFRAIDGALYTKSGKELVSYACGKEVAAVALPRGVEHIRNVAFKKCKNITKVTLPDSVQRIDVAAFKNCENLREINIPYKVTYLDRGTFADCKRLSEVSFRKGFKYIGESVFQSCTALTDIIIPDSVDDIFYDAFWDCNNLTIHASKGSYAEEFANENKIPFKAID